MSKSATPCACGKGCRCLRLGASKSAAPENPPSSLPASLESSRRRTEISFWRFGVLSPGAVGRRNSAQNPSGARDLVRRIGGRKPADPRANGARRQLLPLKRCDLPELLPAPQQSERCGADRECHLHLFAGKSECRAHQQLDEPGG